MTDTKQAPTPGPILCNSNTLSGCPVKADLLAALEALVMSSDYGWVDDKEDERPLMRNARAALSKARGEGGK